MDGLYDMCKRSINFQLIAVLYRRPWFIALNAGRQEIEIMQDATCQLVSSVVNYLKQLICDRKAGSPEWLRR
jgi:hypothetical protein